MSIRNQSQSVTAGVETSKVKGEAMPFYWLVDRLTKRIKDERLARFGHSTEIQTLNYPVGDVDADEIRDISVLGESLIIHLRWGNQTCRIDDLSFSEAAEVYRWIRSTHGVVSNTDEELGINPTYVEPSQKVTKNGRVKITKNPKL
jgi:hypothetical protein